MRLITILILSICCSSFAFSQEPKADPINISAGDSISVVYNETGRIDVELKGRVTSTQSGTIGIENTTKTIVVNKQLPYTNLIPYFGDYFKSVARFTPAGGSNIGRIEIQVKAPPTASGKE